MGERLLCKQEVIGSIPFTSTTPLAARARVAGHDRAAAFAQLVLSTVSGNGTRTTPPGDRWRAVCHCEED